MIRIISKDEKGVKLFLTEDKTWTTNRLKAKEYKGQFWIELLKILVDLIKLFGITNIKFIKK